MRRERANATGGERLLTASDQDLSLIKNALNEVVNGLPIDDFDGRLGAEWDTARALLSDVRFIREARAASGDRVSIALSPRSLDLMKRAFDVALSDIDVAEFQTRLGAEPGEVRLVADKIATLAAQPVAARTIA